MASAAPDEAARVGEWQHAMKIPPPPGTGTKQPKTKIIGSSRLAAATSPVAAYFVIYTAHLLATTSRRVLPFELSFFAQIFYIRS